MESEAGWSSPLALERIKGNKIIDFEYIALA